MTHGVKVVRMGMFLAGVPENRGVPAMKGPRTSTAFLVVTSKGEPSGRGIPHQRLQSRTAVKLFRFFGD